MFSAILSIIIGYVLGSIPFGLIFGKLIWQTDLRDYGSCNIGATNAWRVIGKSAGILVFLFDFLKGFIPVLIAMHLSGSAVVHVLAAIAAIGGHSASLFLHFKGGKGVATGLGVLTILMPIVSLVAFLVWLALVYTTRFVSLGSCAAALLVSVMTCLMNYPTPYLIFAILATILIIYRHKANLERLLDGTENRI